MRQEPGQLSVGRFVLLYVLFFCICLGLGYPILNRIDWRRAPGGLADLQDYAALVTARPTPDPQLHVQFRVLVPYLARAFYHLALNHVGSWDPVMFGLLVANSLLVSGTVMVLLLIALREVGSYPVALGSALLYLLNFAVPNLRLVGFVDAGEAFCLILVMWSMMTERYALLPIWAVAGALAKESFVPFLVVFTATWYVVTRVRATRWRLYWIAAAWGTALLTVTVLQWKITGLFRSPLQFGVGLLGHYAVGTTLGRMLRDGNLYYVFAWLLPLAIPRLGRFSRSWRVSTGATCLCALAMGLYYGVAPGTMPRVLFTIAGPLLTASAAWLLFQPDARSAAKR